MLLLLPLAPVHAQGIRAATVIGVQDPASVRRSGAAGFVGAFRKMSLGGGDIVRTGPGGRATLLFADGSQVKLNADTLLLIPAAAADGGLPPRLGLSGGEVWARITRGRGVSIETPTAVAGVRGTELNLAVAGDGTSTLTVGEGEVRFFNDRGSVLVREAQQSVARPGQAPTVPVTVNVPFIVQWTNDVQPVVLLLEAVFVSQDPARLAAALREAEALPAGAARSLRLGDVRHDRGELPEALAAYEGARTALGVQALEARIGQTLLELGRLTDAEQGFRRALALDPVATAPRVGLVMTLLSRRLDAAARAEARAAVERAPRSPEAHAALALALIRGGERDAAQQALEQALVIDPEYAQAHAWRSFLLRAEGRLDEASEAARRAVALAPFSSLARASLSDALFALGRTREARAEATRAVAANPLSPAAHVSLGRALLQEGSVDRAVREANQAVALDPELDRARFFLGVVLAEQRRLDRAAAELRRAVELDPGYLEARAFLGRVYLEQGRQAAAVAVVQEAINRNPDFAPAHGALGRVYWRAGRLQEAAAEYQTALKREPDSVLYHLELARVYLDQNNLPDALANALTAVTAAPGSSEVHALLGLVYDRRSNREQALREYREALSLSPDNALARLGLGTINPNSTDGLREIAQALLRDPTVPSLIFKPGVTTALVPGIGSHEDYSLGFVHRDQYLRGTVHDLTFGALDWQDDYRTDRQERSTLAVTNVAAAPDYRTHVLGQYVYAGSSSALPGPVFNPDRDDRSYNWNNWFDLGTRLQVDPATSVWFHGVHRLIRIGDRNPDAPLDGGLTPVNRTRSTQLGVEGRLDYRWGRGHTTSYVLFGGREHLQNRSRDFDPLALLFSDTDLFIRRQNIIQTLQDDYRPGSRLALILGMTTERFTLRARSEQAGRQPVSPPGVANTSWLPFGQATYVLSRRDLVRAIAHARRSRIIGSTLQPGEALLVGEFPNVAVDSKTRNYELDYEHRFSARVFAKLFAFRSDSDDLRIQPGRTQSRDSLAITVPRARVAGIGIRYEHQIGRFLSSYLRYTYSDVTDETPRSTSGRQLPLSPHSRALLGLHYIDRAGSKLLLEADWRSKMFVDPLWSDQEAFDALAPRPAAPARLTMNLQIARERTVRREWVFRISNVFDTKTVLWPGFPGPGRTYALQYHIRF